MKVYIFINMQFKEKLAISYDNANKRNCFHAYNLVLFKCLRQWFMQWDTRAVAPDIRWMQSLQRKNVTLWNRYHARCDHFVFSLWSLLENASRKEYTLPAVAIHDSGIRSASDRRSWICSCSQCARKLRKPFLVRLFSRILPRANCSNFQCLLTY